MSEWGPPMDKQKQIWDAIWSGDVSYEWDSLSGLIFNVIGKEAKDINGLNILEAGSGTGRISMRLAQRGANVTLVDYSLKALENSEKAFKERGVEANFLHSDIRMLNILSDSFDITWNAGVLEHFEEEEQVAIVQEMARITKPGGKVVILTPSADCLPYRVGKSYAEEYGTWPYGKEELTTTLENVMRESGIIFKEEYNVGFLNSLDFLDFIPDAGAIKEFMTSWYNTLSAEDKKRFPGYLLVSVGELSKD